MSSKLFLQIIALMIIFVVITGGAKMLKRKYCHTYDGKAKMGAMYNAKMAKPAK